MRCWSGPIAPSFALTCPRRQSGYGCSSINPGLRARPGQLPAVDFEDMLDELGEEWGFEPEILFDALPTGGVAFSDSSTYAIKLTDASGSISRILRRPIRPLPVTERMKHAERERRLEEESNRQATALEGDPPPQILSMINRYLEAQRARVENMQFYPEVPVVAAVRVTGEGTLWIERSVEPGASEPGPTDVIAPDGRYIGTFPAGRLADAGRLWSRRPRRVHRDRQIRCSGHHGEATPAADQVRDWRSPRISMRM